MLALIGPGTIGDGGDIYLNCNENIDIINGGQISASNWGEGNAGELRISAENITIDGKGTGAGIFAQINSEAIGNGFTIT